MREICSYILESSQISVVKAKYRMGVSSIVDKDKDNSRIVSLGDVFFNFIFKEDPNSHVCEIQIVHEKLYLARTELNSHEDYEWLRSAAKLAELRQKGMQGDSGGGGVGGRSPRCTITTTGTGSPAPPLLLSRSSFSSHSHSNIDDNEDLHVACRAILDEEIQKNKDKSARLEDIENENEELKKHIELLLRSGRI